jgi:integrase
VRERPKGSGTYWLFICHNGKRKAKKIGGPKAARAYALRVEQKLVMGDLDLLDKKEKPLLFRDYALQWLSGYVRVSCKYSTWQSYDSILKLHVFPVFGETPLKDIARKKIKELIFSKLSEGLSAKTVHNIIRNLSVVLSHACEDEIIPTNPASRLGKYIKNKDAPKKEIVPLTKDEVLKFLEVAERNHPKYFPTFLLAVSTGMRLGEIIGLSANDIDFNHRLIRVERAIVRCRVGTPKNRRSRTVDMSLWLTDVLRKHLIKLKLDTLKNGWGQPPETLFYNEEGKPLDPDNFVKRSFHRCLKEAGLRRVRFHDLRHSFASIHIQQGESLAYIKEQLGHSSIQVTVDLYGHWIPGQNKEASDRLLSVSPSATYTQPGTF